MEICEYHIKNVKHITEPIEWIEFEYKALTEFNFFFQNLALLIVKVG